PQTSAAPVAPLRLAAADAPAPEPAPATGQPTGQPTGSTGAQAPADAGAAPSGAVLAAIPLTVTVGGDFVAVADFVRIVQTEIDRAFVVDSLDIVTGTPDGAAAGGAGTVEATLTGRVFVFVDPEAATGPAAGDPAATAPAGTPTGTPTGAVGTAPSSTAPSSAEPSSAEPSSTATTEASR
ncbi:MAG: hypothetical protein ACFCVG_16310, partial [Kineosporiaceae bacterium]